MRNRNEHVQAIMAYKDRTRAFKHQINYLNDEVKRGRTGSQDDDGSVSLASGLANLTGGLMRSISTLGGAHK
jgi:hypothetical protein